MPSSVERGIIEIIVFVVWVLFSIAKFNDFEEVWGSPYLVYLSVAVRKKCLLSLLVSFAIAKELISTDSPVAYTVLVVIHELLHQGIDINSEVSYVRLLPNSQT